MTRLNPHRLLRSALMRPAAPAASARKPALLLLLSLSLLLPACTNKTRIVDFDSLAHAVADSLADSPAIAARDAASERMSISLDYIWDDGAHMISGQQFDDLIVGLRSSMPLRNLAIKKSLVFVTQGDAPPYGPLPAIEGPVGVYVFSDLNIHGRVYPIRLEDPWEPDGQYGLDLELRKAGRDDILWADTFTFLIESEAPASP